MKRGIEFLALSFMIMALLAGCSRENNPVDTGLNNIQLRPAVIAPAIGDRVWYDVNMDGLQGEPGDEPGIPGVSVTLMTCDSVPTMVAETVTDTMGYYSFEELAPGDFMVHFELMQGYAFTMMDVGADDMIDSDADPMTGYSDCVSLDSIAMNMDIDGGMFMFDTVNGAVVSDRVWHDADMDGMQGDIMDEPGIEGILVSLYTCADSMVAVDTTDADGFYIFIGLEPGDYYLHFTLPDGYMFSMADAGGDMYDSDVDPMTGMTACFGVAEDVVYIHWDAGMYMIPDDGCTRSKGYWKNHAGFGPQDDMVSDLLPIWLGNDDGDKSMGIVDAQMAVDVLSMHTYGHPSNGITKLYAQMLAAKLNIANGANSADVDDIIVDADNFLAEYDWMDWDDLDMEQRKTVLDWMGTFGDYNQGEIGPGHCDYDDHDNDDNDDDN